MACFDMGFLGSNGITGGGIPIATGAALALSLRKSDQVVVSFFGDGAANQGAFHEALNIGAVWKLPIVYMCENNLYAMSTPFREAFAIEHIAGRAASYGMPGQIVDGNDLLAVKEGVAAAVASARDGKGPTLIECKTYRFSGHSRGDPRIYRTREEEGEWRQKCPLKRFREKLLGEGVLDENGDREVRDDVARELAEAEQFARASAVDTAENIAEDVFA